MDKDIKEMKEKLIPQVEDGTYIELLDKIERRVKDLEIQVKTTKQKKLMRDKEDYNLGRQRNWKKRTFNNQENHYNNNYKPFQHRQYQPYRSNNYQNPNRKYRHQTYSHHNQYPSRPDTQYHHKPPNYNLQKDSSTFKSHTPSIKHKPTSRTFKLNSPSHISHQLQGQHKFFGDLFREKTYKNTLKRKRRNHENPQITSPKKHKDIKGTRDQMERTHAITIPQKKTKTKKRTRRRTIKTTISQPQSNTKEINVFNLSQRVLTQDETSLLQKGLKFAPSSSNSQFNIFIDLHKFIRKLTI
ncbi:Hypothetical predicted protein [Pelobates cultripes]|uniref:Uncharacterized protein n=1 Tax=Pelobates cultripes TaxID=61616 RepID=A0AAD1SJ84_PELCU|nr:Hypothetical predicted protein [Pelobates cultripes]